MALSAIDSDSTVRGACRYKKSIRYVSCEFRPSDAAAVFGKPNSGSSYTVRLRSDSRIRGISPPFWTSNARIRYGIAPNKTGRFDRFVRQRSRFFFYRVTRSAVTTVRQVTCAARDRVLDGFRRGRVLFCSMYRHYAVRSRAPSQFVVRVQQGWPPRGQRAARGSLVGLVWLVRHLRARSKIILNTDGRLSELVRIALTGYRWDFKKPIRRKRTPEKTLLNSRISFLDVYPNNNEVSVSCERLIIFLRLLWNANTCLRFINVYYQLGFETALWIRGSQNHGQWPPPACNDIVSPGPPRRVFCTTSYGPGACRGCVVIIQVRRRQRRTR